LTLMTSIGLMSGTSMDGVDVALIRSDGESIVERGPSLEVEYDPDTRCKIEQGLVDAQLIGEDRDSRPGKLDGLEDLITGLHADAVARFLVLNNLHPGDIDLIGFHGQTVLHRPHIGLTVQLGNGRELAEATGIPVVYDMRANDMRTGGQGAPLVPIYHRALSQTLPRELHLDWPVAFVNIGGISNITYVPFDGELFAFDTGPGNALIDQWVQSAAGIPMDQGGKIASEGEINKTVLDRYLASPYFAQELPKSLDRNDFKVPAPAEMELSDGARTLARLTAKSIFLACVHLPAAPQLWVICGGGRKNKVIMDDLKQLAIAQSSQVMSAEDVGFDGGAMEAEAFAYLAIRASKNMPITFPRTTGCRRPVSGGILVRPT